jgi:hypothetical protein
MTFRIDSSLGAPEKTASGTRVPIYTGTLGQQVEIRHGLGQTPRDIWVTSPDKPCSLSVVQKDAERAIVLFTEAKTNCYVRFDP